MTLAARLLGSIVVLTGTAGLASGACCLPDDSCVEVADSTECNGLGGTYSPMTCAEVTCPFQAVVQVLQFSMPFGGVGMQTRFFAPFDDMDGTRTLQAIHVSQDIRAGCDTFRVENITSMSVETFVCHSGSYSIMPPGDTETWADECTETVLLPPTDGIFGSGPDVHDFGAIRHEFLLDSTITDVAPFLGPDPAEVVFTASNSYFVENTQFTGEVIINNLCRGDVWLRYEYTRACPSDLDGDGTVGFTDLVSLLASWGPCPGGCDADIADGDDDVNFNDLVRLLADWGPCPEPGGA